MKPAPLKLAPLEADTDGQTDMDIGDSKLTQNTNESHKFEFKKNNIASHQDSSDVDIDIDNQTAQASRNSQNQIKRQREWVYLAHYLAIQGLDPIHIISGMDDGKEPDFTLVFWENNQLVYIGVELTTLPRLRTQMSENGLILKRWYWLGLLVMARQYQGRHDYNYNYEHDYEHVTGYYLNKERFKIPMKTLYMPKSQFMAYKQRMTLSSITQKDVDAVMRKKASKVQAYKSRRALDGLWLLIHTDKYQPDSILTFDKDSDTNLDIVLHHKSEFDKINITCYPSYKTLSVEKL